MKIKNIIGILILLILVSSAIVSAGVTNPLPTELELYKGESGRFKFQIQTIAGKASLDCRISLAQESPLEVEFDQEEITVPAESVKDVYGTVTASKSLDLGTYQENFCVSCSRSKDSSGASVEIETCSLPITVNVVSQREKENMYVPPKPFPGTYIALIIAGIVILTAVYYLWKRQKSKPSKIKKSRKRLTTSVKKSKSKKKKDE